MELVRAAAGHHVDFPAGAATVLGKIVGAQDVELGDGIDAGIGKQGEVGAAVDVIGAVDLPVVLRGPRAVDREVDLVRGADRVAHADE